MKNHRHTLKATIFSLEFGVWSVPVTSNSPHPHTCGEDWGWGVKLLKMKVFREGLGTAGVTVCKRSVVVYCFPNNSE